MERAHKTFLNRLWSWVAMLCIGLTLSLSVTTAQASTSVMSHLVCGDTELPDGGWVSKCAAGEVGSFQHTPQDEGQASDVLELNHHHHAEVPSSVLSDPQATTMPSRWTVASPEPEKTAALDDVTPSQADQPPKI